MRMSNLGELEIELLSFISDHSPITVKDALVQFGDPRGLARTTILTVMERLRKKGYLKREDNRGIFEYSPCIKKRDLLRDLTRSFTEKVLGGSPDALVAYLTNDVELTDNQLTELKTLIENMESRRKGESHD